MNEFIMPMKHTGEDGDYICVGFAGLNENIYDNLELSLDSINYIKTERDPDNLFLSLPISFRVPQANMNYEVVGRITIGDSEVICSAKMPSFHYDHNAPEHVRPKRKPTGE